MSEAARHRRLPPAPQLLLAAAVVCSGALLIALGSRLYFYIDDWDLLLHRPGFNADAFLTPHVGHNDVSLVAIYKLLQETFGMDSITPYVVVAVLCFLASAVVLFAYLRTRVGDWLALAGAVWILFLGSAHQDLLIPFQTSFFVPVACGLGALLALERDGPRTDAFACGLLIFGLTFNGLGLAFLVACAIVLGFDRRRLGRLWVVAVPAALYCLWYLAYGHDDPQTNPELQDLAVAPFFILDGFASALSALFGLATPRDETTLTPVDWGRPLLAAFAAIAIAIAVRLRRLTPGLWAAVGAGLTFWLLIAVNADEFRQPTFSRYMYPGAIFVLMIAAELLRGVRPRPGAVVGVFAVITVAVVGNLEALRQDYNTRLPSTAVIAGGLGALDIAADTADPALVLDESNSDFAYYGLIDAGSYLAASREYGSLGYSPAELESAPERGRVAADKVLATALRLQVRPPAVRPPDAGCTQVAREDADPETITLPPGGATIRVAPGAEAELALRRYATESFPIDAGAVAGGDAVELAIPTDRSDRPWQVQVGGAGSFAVCPRLGVR